MPITVFSQEDIDLGRIVYVHDNNMTGEDRIALQVIIFLIRILLFAEILIIAYKQ